MDKKENPVTLNTTQTPQQIVIPLNNIPQKKWICEVCGYANPEYTAQCKKCSNYLQRS